MVRISHRGQSTPPSPIRSLAARAAEAEARGIHVHKLNIGQPNIPSPEEFLSGVHRFNERVVAYDASLGRPSLVHEWCKTINALYSVSITPQEMIITSGSSEALTFSFSVCCDANDDILVFEPTYANYTGFAAMAGINLISVPCEFESSFHLPSKDVIVAALTPKTRAVLVCNPNNPTGTALTDAELEVLVDVCATHNIFLIVDEVYREFVYDGRTPKTIFQDYPKHNNIIVIDSVSKRYSLCGARVGCIISWNKDVLAAAGNFASTRVSAPTIEQFATAHMLKTIQPSYLESVVQEYERRNTTLTNGLNSIPGVQANPAEGGFYVLAILPVEDVEDFATFLLDSFSLNGETVFIAPACGFYVTPDSGKNAARIAFVLSDDEIKRAVTILEKALEAYTVDTTLSM